MNQDVQLQRVVVIRQSGKPDWEVTVPNNLRFVCMPTFDPTWTMCGTRKPFGQKEYRWDGKETTVSGLPVYR